MSAPAAETAASSSPDTTKKDHPSQATTSQDLLTLQSLLGPNVTSWPFSDEALTAALVLRTEQERSKQELARLEVSRVTAAIVEEAGRYGIPPSVLGIMVGAAATAATTTGAGGGNGPVEVGEEGVVEYIKRVQAQTQAQAQARQAQAQAGMQTQFQNQGPPPPLPQHQVKGHQRNMSMPQQPTIIEYQPLSQSSQQQQQQQSQSQPAQSQPGQSQTPKYRHAHHASMSSISPSRSSQQQQRQPWQTAPTAYFPNPQPYAPQQPGAGPGNSPTTSVHHIIQFHHWTPNQTKPAGTSPKKDGSATLVTPTGGNSQGEDGSTTTTTHKRRRSLTGETAGDNSERSSASPTPFSGTAVGTLAAPTPTPAAIGGGLKRRNTHSRHKSETSAIRTDMSRISLSSGRNSPANATNSNANTIASVNAAYNYNYNFPTSNSNGNSGGTRASTSPTHAHTRLTHHTTTTPTATANTSLTRTEDTSGFKYLAEAAAAAAVEAKRVGSSPERGVAMLGSGVGSIGQRGMPPMGQGGQGGGHGSDQRHKQNVNFMISEQQE